MGVAPIFPSCSHRYERGSVRDFFMNCPVPPSEQTIFVCFLRRFRLPVNLRCPVRLSKSGEDLMAGHDETLRF